MEQDYPLFLHCEHYLNPTCIIYWFYNGWEESLWKKKLDIFTPIKLLNYFRRVFKYFSKYIIAHYSELLLITNVLLLTTL